MDKEIPGLPPLPRVVIHPGTQHVSVQPELIQTLLGSCIAACLYDPTTGVAGMNHFLLANRRYAREMPVNRTEAGRYGVHAMELLINEMLKKGADRRHLHAKVFGGGAVLGSVSNDNFQCVGSVNERFIREFLKTEGIPLESEDLGGTLGRVIKFRTDTFAVYRRFIQKTQTYLVEKKERHYWQDSIKEHVKEEKGPDVILFN